MSEIIHISPIWADMDEKIIHINKLISNRDPFSYYKWWYFLADGVKKIGVKNGAKSFRF
jgi:hypothetical protein